MKRETLEPWFLSELAPLARERNLDGVLDSVGMTANPVRRCKFDPGLKAPCFQPLSLLSTICAYVAFKLNLTFELAPPLQPGARAQDP